MNEIPSHEPTTLTAGDSWRWDKSVSGHSAADGWALSYAIRGGGVLDVGVAEVTASGEGWQVRIPAASTAALPAGTYQVAGYVTKGTDRFEVYRDVLVVRANLTTVTDGRSHAEKALAAIDAAIEGRLTRDVEDFTINGRAVKHIAIAELRKLRGTYAHQVWRERNPGRLGPSIGVRFRGLA